MKCTALLEHRIETNDRDYLNSGNVTAAHDTNPANASASDTDTLTPKVDLAITKNDGKDFVPTNKCVVFGHHFAAIAGPGPLVGPVLAAQFGYLPGMLWILIGATLGGGVHDHRWQRVDVLGITGERGHLPAVRAEERVAADGEQPAPRIVSDAHSASFTATTFTPRGGYEWVITRQSGGPWRLNGTMEGSATVLDVASGLPVGPPPGVVPKPLLGMPPFSGPQGPFAGITVGPDGTLYVSADGDGSVLALRRE